MRADTVTTAIVIPARNEEARITACLRALAAQCTQDVAVIIVANNCTDQTVPVARALADACDLSLEILACTLPAEAGVGTARRLGADHAVAMFPRLTQMLTTDADCCVAPDWVARNRAHLRDVAAVCGCVIPMASERSVLASIETGPAEMEGRYERLVTAFYRHARPGPLGLEGDHSGTAGASLGVRLPAYTAIGGFGDLATGEDRDLVRRLKEAGYGVRHAGDVAVSASCRLVGRASGGMAAALRARVDHMDYLIDDALPPSQVLLDAATRNELGPWPLQVASADRLRARDLAPHISRLEEALRMLPCNALADPGCSR